MERLTADACRCTRLKTSHAFHSALMDPMLEPFRAFADGIDYRPPRIKLVSNVTGRVLEAGTIPNASYWTQHVRAPVRFADGIDALRALGAGRCWKWARTRY
jgi:acyl transferase domain-containing protein